MDKKPFRDYIERVESFNILIQVKVSERMKEDFEAKAKELGLTTSESMRALIRWFLDQEKL